MPRTFVATFSVVVENDDASLEDVRDYLGDALTVDLDTEDTDNTVGAVSAAVNLEGLIEEVAVDAEYTSEWDSGEALTTKCKYYPVSRVCTDIGDSGEAPEGTLNDEWVTLADGTELRVSDGVTLELWRTGDGE